MEKEEQKLEEEEMMEEQEKEETTQLVRKSRNGDDSKVFAISTVESNGHAVQSVISAVDVEVSNGVSESNGHAIHSEIAENEETITPAAEEQKIEETDRVHENGAKNVEPITPAAEEEHKIEESDRVLESGVLITPAAKKEQKIQKSERVLESESEAINGEQNSDNLVFYEKIKGIWKCRICTWTYGNGSVCVDLIQNHRGQLHNLMNIKTLNFESEGQLVNRFFSCRFRQAYLPVKDEIFLEIADISVLLL